MKQNFDEALEMVLVHEGGYVNHPKDPGGATNRGVTQRTYTSWLRRNGLQSQDVRNITYDEIKAIYKTQYWDMVRADELPNGVDYAVFDFAVNSGPSRAARFVQAVVGVEQDGAIGSVTLAAILDADPIGLCADLCDNRLAWLKRLSTFSTFGRGWTRRVNDVRVQSILMARGGASDGPLPLPVSPTPRTPAEPHSKPTAQVKDNAGNLSLGAIFTALASALGVTEGTAQLIVIGGMVAIGLAFVAMNWRKEA